MFNQGGINVIKRPKTKRVDGPIRYIWENAGAPGVFLPFYCL
jgi:hypothetical protein